jgi:SAM-dependent methyltransferase
MRLRGLSKGIDPNSPPLTDGSPVALLQGRIEYTSQKNRSTLRVQNTSIDWQKWFAHNIAARGGLFKYVYDSWVFNSTLYDTLFRILPPPKKVIEIGCGYGIDTILLACFGYEVMAVDIDEKMLSKAMDNASLFERVGSTPVKFELADAFDLSKYYGEYDIAFSDGVIEHFTPEEAARAIREQAKAARFVVVAVPTRYLNETFDGYRYPYTLRTLALLCKECGLIGIKNLALGNPPQRHLVALQRVMPHFVWNMFLRGRFAVKAACICRSTYFEQ